METAAGRPNRRVGLLVPSSNTVMEIDFHERLGASATVHTARMYLEEITPEAEEVMLDEHTLPAARDVGTVRPDVVVFGCTSAGALRGNEYGRWLCDRIGVAAGAEVVSVTQAVQETITRHGASRVAIVTPYVDALNDRIRASITDACDVEVPVIAGLGIDDNRAIGAVAPADIVGFAEDVLRDVEADLLFVSCTNFRAVEAIPVLEQRFGIPVVSSNQATLDKVSDVLAGVS